MSETMPTPFADRWRERLVGGFAGYATVSLACAAMVALLALFVPVAHFVDGNPGKTTTSQRAAWFISVSGLTSWLPLCGLVCLRIHARSRWTPAIPVVALFGLACSVWVARHALQVCSPWTGGACW